MFLSRYLNFELGTRGIEPSKPPDTYACGFTLYLFIPNLQN